MKLTDHKSLRTKMLLAMAAGMLLLFALIFFVARTVLLDGYAKLEKDKTNILVNSAISLINDQSNQLSSSVRDNAHSNDIYEYMVTQNSAFIEPNFNDNLFTNVKVNAVFIVNNDGETLYKRGFDYASGKPWHIPDLLEQAIKAGGT